MRHIPGISVLFLLATVFDSPQGEAQEKKSPLGRWTLDRKHVQGSRVRPSE